MTHNQIEFWKLKEMERANRAQELENTRSNRQREIENSRSNRAQEDLRSRELTLRKQIEDLNRSETQRSNVAREAENRRANDLTYLTHAQQNMVSTINAQETARANRANESINRFNSMTNQMRVGVESTRNAQNYSIGLTNAKNTLRNIIGNLQLGASNVELGKQRNALQSRAIAAQEKRDQLNYLLGSRQQDINLSNLEELKRHNQVGEYIGAMQTAMKGAGLLLGGIR